MTQNSPFSARNRGRHAQVESDFPKSARIGLAHILLDLVERRNVKDWVSLARELQRIGRLQPEEYNATLVKDIERARADSLAVLFELEWSKVFDFCERLHGHLAYELVYCDAYDNCDVQISKGDSQTYVAHELQRLYAEEGLAYEFIDGLVRRRGRKHTSDLMTRAQVVLGDLQLSDARKHYEKAVQFFRRLETPDYENAVKEAVCALEAAGKALFPAANAKTLSDLLRWFGPQTVDVPKTLIGTITGIYSYRSSAAGVGHGGTSGGEVTAALAEFVLAVCASQIILFVDLSTPSDFDVPF